MSHELLPQNVGLASGMMLGLAIGFGGLGVAVNGMIADHYSLAAALEQSNSDNCGNADYVHTSLSMEVSVIAFRA